MEHDPFKEYIRQAEPNKRERGYAWHTAIGLQAVDGLKPSQYLIDTAIKNIEGDISMDEIIHHLAIFVSRLWQIHIFGEGNTRTTAVFFIKYLRTLGFDATNDIFAENAWYFRNALVRANYNNLKKGVHETTEFLELFLRNLLLDETNVLHNRSMHISGVFLQSAAEEAQSAKTDKPKCKNCTIEEQLIIKQLLENPSITQKELAKK